MSLQRTQPNDMRIVEALNLLKDTDSAELKPRVPDTDGPAAATALHLDVLRARLGALVRRYAKRVIVSWLILASGSPAEAQYFGRNKVRYRSFDFQVLKTEHFDIYFYASERGAIDIAARLAERWYTRLERLFEHELQGRQPLILYRSHSDFEQTNVIPEQFGEGTGGVTEPVKRRIVLPLAGPIADTDHVIGHELVHAFQFDMTGDFGGQPGEIMAGLPLWFSEGMAEYISLGNVDANTAMKLRDAVRRDRLPSIHDLSRPKYFPYQWGHAVFAYIAGRYGETTIPRLLRMAAAVGNVEAAINDVLGVSEKQLSIDWHEAIRSLYAPVLSAAVPITDGSRILIQAQGLGAELNIGPALSPDGRWIAFLSSRGLFSTDLYVADAVTGHIIRKLTRTANDPHYSSIEFIHSAGSWDPSSERLAMATVSGGRPALAIFTARTGKHTRDIVVSGVDEILNPAWSPDGHAIAFTGMRAGLTDLYVYNLGTATLAQITNDAYADLHPAWAPDSRRVVFASDRFSSDLESLHMGAFRLALVDAETHTIEQITTLGRGKSISPKWSPDGQSLYFVGDPDGVPNIYRLSLVNGAIEQLTILDTGVSGITPLSPALSVATRAGRLAVSVFENDKYNIYVRDAGQPAAPIKALAVNAAALPPGDRRTDVLTALLSQPNQGLPVPQTYPTIPYKATLSLAGVGQPTAGMGVGQFGAEASGSGSLLFADTLSDHLLATAFQANGAGTGFNGIAFQGIYLNMVRRWNWGIVAGQIPYVYGAIGGGLAASPAGHPTVIDRDIFYRQTERGGSGILAYPFDRRRRVQFRCGFAHTSFDQILGMATVLSETTTTTPFAPSLNLVTSAVALVEDGANFGPTSPIQGERYHFEVSPAFGSINFTGVLLDYRRYIMPVPFYTIAARVIHYGRYGAGGDDDRLYPVYIDNPAFVRGYDSIGDMECAPTSSGDCERADRLVGSRMLVGNLELRFPVLRPFGVSHSMYAPVPVEVALFADSGLVWTGQERRSLGGTRRGVRSAGVAARVSFGAGVVEFDVTRPFQRPGRGWVYGFNLMPGW